VNQSDSGAIEDGIAQISLVRIVASLALTGVSVND